MSQTTAPPPPTDDGGPRVTTEEMRDLGRLRRSSTNRYLGGVCGGIARHLDIDPRLVRVVMALLVFFGGAGLVIYGACWLIVPEDSSNSAMIDLDTRSRTVALLVVGGVGALTLVGNTVAGFDLPWPLTLVAAIALVVLFTRRNSAAATYPNPYRPAASANQPSGPTTSAKPRPYQGPLLFLPTLLLIVVAWGVVGMVDLANVDVPGVVYPVTALGVIGAMLVVGAFWGRAGGLIALGLVAALCTAGAAAADEFPAGDLRATPTTAAATQASYQRDLGAVALDLTEVSDPHNLDGRTIRVRVDIGEVKVTVPDTWDVTVRSTTDIGERTLFGTSEGSGEGTINHDGNHDGNPDGADPNAPHVTLDLSVDIGHVVVATEGSTR